MNQMHLFPELDPFKTKIKNIDYIDVSEIKNIGISFHSNTVVNYSTLEKGRYILFKKGGTNEYMPELGNCFPYIQNIKKGNVLSAKISGSYSYPKESLNGNGIHRLVAMAFIENDMPNKKWMVDHINGNPLDYRVENLRWVSSSENGKNKNNYLKNET
jgi:hypothetical protein|tara:strand:- start:45 stop:518 length:474 start_codon:yes stop_codon:yes gene_type:complete